MGIAIVFIHAMNLFFWQNVPEWHEKYKPFSSS